MNGQPTTNAIINNSDIPVTDALAKQIGRIYASANSPNDFAVQVQAIVDEVCGKLERERNQYFNLMNEASGLVCVRENEIDQLRKVVDELCSALTDK